jgi:acetyl-CoA C-acetyltransferase
MTSVHVWGVGMSQFGRFPERRLEDIAWDAIGEALEDAEVEPAQIELVYVGNVFGPSGVGARIARAAGISGAPVLAVEAACASGTTAAHLAVTAVREERCRVALAVGIETMSTRFDGAIVPEASDAEGAAGLPLPGLYALQASRYLAVHGRDSHELAGVAVKNRANGAANPRAARREAVSIERVLQSRMIADPLTVLQCCPVSDGAGAAVIGLPRERAEDVPVLASALAGGAAWPAEPDELWGVGAIRRAARRAETDAAVALIDADVIEVHDAFTIGELVTLEALGLCDAGSALDHLEAGDFAIGGRWAVNPSGGLLSRGHPLGATGLAQIAEVVWQLRGRAGVRQQPNARLGVVETMGGGASGLDGNAAAVLVLGEHPRR